ncbi:MAG: hypothetical protein Q7K26_00100, partial [bacterium]|nr:hypothetical protein [bacterium]
SATRARTWDILLTLIPKFLKGMDYIITRSGCKALRPDVTSGLLPEGIVSEPAITCFAIRSFSEGLAADYPRLDVRASSTEDYFINGILDFVNKIGTIHLIFDLNYFRKLRNSPVYFSVAIRAYENAFIRFGFYFFPRSRETSSR